MSQRFSLKGLREEGSQGRIFDAEEPFSELPCIVKFGQRARDEALLTLELNHPCILRPLDCGVDPLEGQFAVYPVVAGEPLRAVWRRTGEMGRRRILLQIAEFLAYLHSRGWLYTDFKPEHFYLNEGHLQVIDLGLCTPLTAGVTGMKTYSGTYPFISPERMTGRPFDQRSDLYSLGIMILDLFSPLPVPLEAPRVIVPPGIRGRVRRMKGIWKDVVSELVAPEPSQRPGSALELRTRLLPKRVRQTPLFFSVPGSATMPESVLESTGVTVIQSPSGINLDEAEKHLTANAWKRSGRVISMDLSAGSVKQFLIRAAWLLTGRAEPEMLTAVSLLKLYSGESCWFVVRNPEVLEPEDLSLFSFALTSLSQSQSFHIFVLTTHLSDNLMSGGWNLWQPSPFLAEDIPELARIICPSNGEGLLTSFSHGQAILPEQVLFELQKKIEKTPAEWWPSAGWRYRPHVSFELLKAREKGALLKLALCSSSGGRIGASALTLTGCSQAAMQGLIARGWIKDLMAGLLLTVPADDVVRRFRATMVRAAALKLMSTAKSRGDAAVVYKLSRVLRLKSLSAAMAARLAQEIRESDREAALEWMWKAFECGHAPDRVWSLEMIRHNLHRMRLSRVRRLLIDSAGRHRRTLSLADRYLDLLHRRNDLARAATYAGKLAGLALARSLPGCEKYFLARQAGFLILANKFSDGEIVLERSAAIEFPETERIEGLIHHFRGLLFLQRGDIPAAILESERAASLHHRFQATSFMNLSLAEMLSGNDKAFEHMEESLARFTASQDLLRLSFAYNNYGVYFRRGGDLNAARANYYKSYHMSRACRNSYIHSAALDNLGTTFALEGRTQTAIQLYRKAIRVARKAKLPEREAHALSNAGLQHAFTGRFHIAISSLRRALKLRKQLGMKLMMADAQEYLGLTFMMLGQTRKAREFLETARSVYVESKMEREAGRVWLYIVLGQLESGATSAELPGEPDAFPEGSFERGLCNYVRALCLKRSNRADSLRELNNAELNFRKQPALFWLGRTLKEKALYHLEAGNYEKAVLSFQAASDIFGRMDARHEMNELSEGEFMKTIPEDYLKKISEKMPYHVLLMVQEVLKEKDTNRMVDRILTTSLEFTGMERAVLILEQDPPRVFKSTALDAAAIREIHEISRSAADAASRTAKPFICHDASLERLVKSRPSIIANRITSIACLPLFEGDRLLGYLYLDSREGVESLAATETTLLEIFASIVAMALRTGLLLEQSARELEGLKESIGQKSTTPEIVANSRAMLSVLKMVHRLIGADLPVLITGDTGTGKEAIARLLHFEGNRKNGPFVAVNGSAITETLLESELFGHEKGSFTGATSQRKGLFEEAKDGTLFIDEIAEMSLSMQAKLLRVLQEGEYRRVGGSATLKTNVRVIAATNRNLAEMVSQRVFREDLYYRVRGAQVHLPPLRERAEDIVPLGLFFLRNAAVASRKRIRGLRPETYPILRRYPWPGNVRELRNEMERIAAMTENEWIVPADFDPQILAMAASQVPDLNKLPTLREAEKELILQRLKRSGWNIHQTARSLGITRNGLYGKMTQYSIPRKKISER